MKKLKQLNRVSWDDLIEYVEEIKANPTAYQVEDVENPELTYTRRKQLLATYISQEEAIQPAIEEVVKSIAHIERIIEQTQGDRKDRALALTEFFITKCFNTAHTAVKHNFTPENVLFFKSLRSKVIEDLKNDYSI